MSEGTDPAGGGTKSGSSWAKAHKTEVYLGLAGIVVTAALYMKSKSSSSSSAPAAAPTPSSAVYLPSTTGGETGSPSSPVSWTPHQPVTVRVVGTKTTKTPGSSSPPPPTPPSAGFGTVQSAKYGPLIWLGTAQNGQNTGFNVGGGAPVLYGNATTASQGWKPGDYYVPAQYANLVSKTPTAVHQKVA